MSKVVPREELLPCPFCGALPTVAEWPNGFEIQCVNHKCAIDSGPMAEHRLLDEAAAAWNTRAPAPPPATPVEGAWDAELDGYESRLRSGALTVDSDLPAIADLWVGAANCIRSLRIQLATLESALAACRGDAERLDWINKQSLGDLSFCLVVDRPHDGEYEVNFWANYHKTQMQAYGPTLRAAIDRAILASAPKSVSKEAT